MAKGNNVKKDRNGKKIKVGSKVLFDKFIWEVGAFGTDRVWIFREKKSRLYRRDEDDYILNIVKADELVVI